MKIFPFRTELRTMHSYKAVSKRKWQRRSCWRSSFFTHLQTRSPFYFSSSFVRLTYFITDMKLFCGSLLDLVDLDHNPAKLALFLSPKYPDSFPDWKTAETHVWLLNFFTVCVQNGWSCSCGQDRHVSQDVTVLVPISGSLLQSHPGLFAICAGTRATALGFTLRLPSGMVCFTRAPFLLYPSGRTV